MQRLSHRIQELGSAYDAVVVGSGYGGGVAASRLARMGFEVAVLERGEEILPGEFPDTPDEALARTQVRRGGKCLGDRVDLFDLRIGEDINVLVGCGLGGTSLINANVALEADPRVFDDPIWPSELNGGDLAVGYERARTMLRPSAYPADWPVLNKLAALEKAGAALGAAVTRPPINVNFEAGTNPSGVSQPACNLCGDCCSGCNTGAKNTTAMNYLPDAAAFGAKIFCRIEVRAIERSDSGWRVRYVPRSLGRETYDAPEQTIRAKIVVLAAGTLGSTEILLRSRERGLPLSPALGSRFSGNGDVLAFGYNNDQPIDGIGFGERAAAYDWKTDERRPVGPTIAGLIDLRSTARLDDGMVIEEGAIPGGLARFLPPVMATAAAAFGTDSDGGDLLSERAREIESLAHGSYRGAVNNTQTFLVMSHDDAGGQLRLDRDELRIDWPGVGHAPGFQAVAAKLGRAVAATGGTYVPNPIWTEALGHGLVTVHPLGGCPMGRDAAVGVVDADCRVFDGLSGSAVHDDLYVCDGSVIPRSLGVNPLLTITAFAERAMIHLAERHGRRIDMAPVPARAPAAPGEETVGIRFTERMAGQMRSHSSGAVSDAEFVLTVVAEDADRFMSEPSHEADLVGTFSIPAVSNEPLTVHGGTFNLFTVDPERVETRRMEYRMPLAARDGKRYYFEGEKSIHDDAGFDLWSDTTRLAARLREGDCNGPLLFEGELRIAPLDFVRQMRTLRVTGAPDLATRLATTARFGRFFAGQLFDSFGGPFVRPSLFDPDAIRIKRPLRAAAPEIHQFQTEDGKTLRFTRYRGGGKGPVILSHGLGVSSLIFAIDTIETNLVEYMVAAGYDCWLLDYRASVALGYAREQFTADDIAERDYPAAVDFVREATGSDSVQMIAHCYGAMTFSMAMLRGLQGVRAAVVSQIAAHAEVPFFPQRMLAYLRAPDIMRALGADHLDARASHDRNALSAAIDHAMRFFYPARRDDRSRSATSRRITALYGQLYQLDQLNQATLDAMPEMFGKANIAAFRHLSAIARTGHVIRADGRDDYLSDANLKRFAIPTLFVHGALNRTFSPPGTARTMAELARVNGAALYERREIAATGHIDCIFGKNAARDVYPRIVRHLDASARLA